MLGSRSFIHSFGFNTETVAGLAKRAGIEIRKVYARANFNISRKDDDSPVTEADFVAHDLISSELTALTPTVPVISEETNLSEIDIVKLIDRADSYWLVDPLDGTKDFVNRTGDFTVNIALVAGGRPVLGYVYVPMRDELYAGGEGVGAFRRVGETEEGESIATRQLPESPVCLVSRFHQGDVAAEMQAKWPQCKIEVAGSSVKYCRIAEGSADFSLRLGATKLWDTAAAQCILEAAGGRMLDLHGMPLDYRRHSVVNPPFYAAGDAAVRWG